MERKTLLQMTTDILEMMESDLVTSINDTLESTMVHKELRNTYMHLMARQDWEHLRKIMTLDAVIGTTRPTTLAIPDTVAEIAYLKYDKSEVGGRLKMVDLIYKSPEDFINLLQSRDTTQANVTKVTAEYTNIDLPIFTDQDPTYWTSFDNKHIFMDSYDSTKDTSKLDNTKTQMLAIVTPTWTETDAFIPEMPPQLFPMLIYEAADACMELHDKEESGVVKKRALLHKAIMKTKEVRHDGKTKKGFGRR